MSSNKKLIVFFDGDCNLCNASVDFLIKKDKKRRLHFSSLQGETAKKLLKSSDYKNIDSVLFLKNNRVYTKSSAALRAFAELSCVYKPALLILMIPSFARDALYDFIASNRYKWFGKRDTCKLTTKKEEAYLLP